MIAAFDSATAGAGWDDISADGAVTARWAVVLNDDVKGGVEKDEAGHQGTHLGDHPVVDPVKHVGV
jgi:hypothetical protein